jgi:hypothetical protein
MPLSKNWSIENTIYNQNQVYIEPLFIEVHICIDTKNDNIRSSYITKKILKGTEKDFFKKLGTKSKANESNYFAYIIIDNKIQRFYYSTINIIKKDSLISFNNERYIVESINGSILVCRNRKKEYINISYNDIQKVMRY